MQTINDIKDRLIVMQVRKQVRNGAGKINDSKHRTNSKKSDIDNE